MYEGNSLLPSVSTSTAHVSSMDILLVRIAAVALIASAVVTVGFIALTHSWSLDTSGSFQEPGQIRPGKPRKVGLFRARNASSCVDEEAECRSWAESGECENNSIFMLASCRQSCGKCPVSFSASCVDQSSFCGEWAAIGECLELCSKSAGL